MTIAILLAIAAAAVYLWPSSPRPAAVARPPMLAPPVDRAPRSPTYQGAMSSLAQVRHRLIATDNLTDAAKAAVDALTLALVAGSDKE
jgi:hypothetical protein